MTSARYSLVVMITQLAIVVPMSAESDPVYSPEAASTDLRGEMHAVIAAQARAVPPPGMASKSQTISAAPEEKMDRQFISSSQLGLGGAPSNEPTQALFPNQPTRKLDDVEAPLIAVADDPENKTSSRPPKLFGDDDPTALSSPADDITRLSSVIVRGEKIINIPESELYSKDAFMDIIMRRYLTEFDYAFLNRFTLPLYGSASREKRAREAYQRDQNIELKELCREFGEPDFDLHSSATSAQRNLP